MLTAQSLPLLLVTLPRPASDQFLDCQERFSSTADRRLTVADHHPDSFFAHMYICIHTWLFIDLLLLHVCVVLCVTPCCSFYDKTLVDY